MISKAPHGSIGLSEVEHVTVCVHVNKRGYRMPIKNGSIWTEVQSLHSLSQIYFASLKMSDRSEERRVGKECLE